MKVLKTKFEQNFDVKNEIKNKTVRKKYPRCDIKCHQIYKKKLIIKKKTDLNASYHNFISM